jgi:hypothetical protein
VDDLSQLGSSPILPLADLNLAGASGPPDPGQVARPQITSTLHQPDYQSPDMCDCSLKFGDLAASDIDAHPEFQPDPLQPDLTQIPEPHAVTVYTNNLMPAESDVAIGIPSSAEVAASMYPGLGFNNLDINHHYLDPDPAVPSLQNPDLTPDVTMPDDERPGELDPNAMRMLQSEMGQHYTMQGEPYRQSFMDQRGNNSHRERHNDILLDGLL